VAAPIESRATSLLRVRPFRGMRYNPAAVPDLADVTSPPYDVMDRQMIDVLLDESPRNVVRLILPRMVSGPVTDTDPYARAALLMQRWRREGVLLTEPGPALYAYQYGAPDALVCGLIGAIELRQLDEHVVLPHEDVMEPIVADRLAMMSAAQANLEPIMLVYDADGAISDILDAASAGEPLIDISADDGTVHRLWPIADPADIHEVDRRLSPHQALIADGHHRYATYLRLQARFRADGSDSGPWDRGLALLIDQSTCPVQLGAIHRSVGDLSIGAAVAPPGFSLRQVGEARDVDAPPADRGEFVVSDGRSAVVVAHDGERDPSISDAELLHATLLPAWQVSEDRLGYHHSVAQALRAARQSAGVAVLLHPAAVSEVMDVARAGKTMPRKSTSFGPKPRTGLVMRTFADEL
jgi:uncharacterized protein (DUF1015 family)